MSQLSTFLRSEIQLRNWSIDQFAQQADLSLSRAYQIIRDGKDNVRQSTFERIAEALGMTAAELAIQIGKGPPDTDPRRAALALRIRALSDNDLTFIERVLHSFSASPSDQLEGSPSYLYQTVLNTLFGMVTNPRVGDAFAGAAVR